MARCARCNRVLKSPDAVESGLGAVCYRKTFGTPLRKIEQGRSPKSGTVQGINLKQPDLVLSGQVTFEDVLGGITEIAENKKDV